MSGENLLVVGVDVVVLLLLVAVRVDRDRKAADLDHARAPAYLRLFRRRFVTIRGAGRSVASSPRSGGTGTTVPVEQAVEHNQAMSVTPVGGQPPDVRQLMRRWEEERREQEARLRREREMTAEQLRAELDAANERQERRQEQLRDGLVAALRSSWLDWAIVALFLASVALTAFVALA